MLTTNKNIINQKANNTPSNSKLLLISTKQNHQSDKEIENKINFLKIHQMKLNFIKKEKKKATHTTIRSYASDYSC